jgi:heme A synthase
MEISKLASRIPIFPLFIAVSLLVGWLIPGFYAWTDSDQSRPSPLLWKVPLSSAIGSVAFCLALPWLPITIKPSYDTARLQMRFSLRTLLMLTTGVAVAIVLLAKFPLAVSGIVCGGAFAHLIAFCVRNPQHRMASAALLACMALPYAWVVGYKELGRILPDLAVMFAGMPAFVPAALIGRLFEQNMHDTPWLAFLLTALELVIGIWMIRLGLKRTIAYLLLVMQLSVLGSLFFYMLVRA